MSLYPMGQKAKIASKEILSEDCFMIKPLILNTACHLVMGFLGSGKTSFINACIAHFQHQQKWAILVNEAGQIGIDEKLFSSGANNDLAIRQVSGGCICCTSQLPLQIALARLTSEYRPDRLWIEPTGLAHPRELIEQLSAPHWQTALSLKSAVSIVNARHWQDARYHDNEDYQAHVRFCDVVVINRWAELTERQKQSLTDWVLALNPNANLIWQDGASFSQANLHTLQNYLNQTSQVLANRSHYQQVSLAGFVKPTTRFQPPANTPEPDNPSNDELPFRYHDVQNGYQIMGWRVPADWTIDMTVLMDWLLSLPNWQRIKSVIHLKDATLASDNWQTMNFTPDSLDLIACEPQTDNRIEVIFLNDSACADNGMALDFQKLDTELMMMFGHIG